MQHQQTSRDVDSKGISRRSQKSDPLLSDTCPEVSQMLVQRDQSSVETHDAPSCYAILPYDCAHLLSGSVSPGCAPSFPKPPLEASGPWNRPLGDLVEPEPGKH